MKKLLKHTAPLLVCFFGFSAPVLIASVETFENAPLTDRRGEAAREEFFELNDRDRKNPHPAFTAMGLSEEVQRSMTVLDTLPAFSTVQITDIFRTTAVDDPRLRAPQSSGTGFFVIDRRLPANSLFRPLNLATAPEVTFGPFPRTFLVTNKHVLNKDRETVRERRFGSEWEKGFYKFSLHLVAFVGDTDDRGMPIRRATYQTALVTMPLADLEIRHLPNDTVTQPGISAQVDLAAIDVAPIFGALHAHIIATPALAGYVPYFSAFDTIEGFSEVPSVGTEVATCGYPLGMTAGGMMPVYGRGRVSGEIATIEQIDVVDGYFDLDIANGTSGSPVFSAGEKLVGVSFASSNEKTHRLGRIIGAHRVRELIETF